METFMKILHIIADILKVWFGSKGEVAKNEREKRAENKATSEKLNQEIQDAVDAVESGDEDKLNEILR